MLTEFRDRARIAIFKEIFGEHFRMDRPVETLGGRLRRLIDMPETDRFKKEQGEIKGLLRALQILDEQHKEMM
jgi:hypothetical protein